MPTAAAKQKTRTPEEVAADLLVAKAEESNANTRRVALEEEMIALLGAREKGAQTHNLHGYKVVIEGKLNVKVDWDAYDLVVDKVPAHLRPETMVRTFEPAGVHYLRENEPRLFAILAPSITIKPAKTSVAVTPDAVSPAVKAQLATAVNQRVAQIKKARFPRAGKND